jgi:hypothetical protein
MRSNPLLLPGAVVIGSGLIGLGLYFGLRASAPAPIPSSSTPVLMTATSQPPAASTAPAGSSEPARPTAAGTAGSLSQEVVERVKKSATEALLAEKKAKFLPRCWEPALAREPQPATSKYLFELSFDADGRENVRGIHEPRGESRGDVGQCMREIPMGIRITPAPGAPVMVSVELTFP